MNLETSLVMQRHAPLRERYRRTPEVAWITDGATALHGAGLDPFHGLVQIGTSAPVRFSYGIHRAVGGDHDLPNPGDLLCAALAACLDATLRMVADRFGVTVQELTVTVSADVDVRGTLAVRHDVPVGFQAMHCRVDLAVPADTNHDSLEAVKVWSERSCVNLQTLRRGVDIDTVFRVRTEPDAPECAATGKGGD